MRITVHENEAGNPVVTATGDNGESPADVARAYKEAEAELNRKEDN